jgi:hypothetical protein
MWLLPTTVNAEGTPDPPRWVALAYEVNAGDVAIVVFLAAICFTLVALALIGLTRDRQE